jgi:hypothetical protein
MTKKKVITEVDEIVHELEEDDVLLLKSVMQKLIGNTTRD